MSKDKAVSSVGLVDPAGKPKKKRDRFGRTETARHRAIALQAKKDFGHIGDSRLGEATDYWEVMDAIEAMTPSYLHSPNEDDRRIGVALLTFKNKRSHQ